MRRSLVWALAATVALSLIAWWTQDRAPALVAAIEPSAQEHARSQQPSTPLVDAGSRAAPPLPAELPIFNLEAASRDILSSAVLTKQLPVAQKTPAASPVISVVDNLQPQAPALSLRYTGSLLAPDGRRIVYLTRGNTSFEVATGDRLEEGYVVEVITEGHVALVYPPLGTKLTVAITPAQAQ